MVVGDEVSSTVDEVVFCYVTLGTKWYFGDDLVRKNRDDMVLGDEVSCFR